MKLDIAICLIFKDSAAYLEEWLLFHLATGFNSFFLYNNDSSDDYLPILEPFIRQGIVSLEQAPGSGRQQEIYNKCLLEHGSKVDWLAFIDDDEFFYPSIPPPPGWGGGGLSETLAKYSSYAGIAVVWELYGSSNHIKKQPGYVISNFTLKCKKPDQHVKCIVQPRFTECSVLNGHIFQPKPGYITVDEKMKPFRGPFHGNATADVLRINHYLVKSYEELEVRRLRPDVDTGKPKNITIDEWKQWDQDLWNETFDDSATYFIPKMERLRKEIIGRKKSLFNPFTWLQKN